MERGAKRSAAVEHAYNLIVAVPVSFGLLAERIQYESNNA
jgi:hypothetical protein